MRLLSYIYVCYLPNANTYHELTVRPKFELPGPCPRERVVGLLSGREGRRRRELWLDGGLLSDEQWAEARRLVDEGLPDSAGMSREKRDTITNLLAHGRL